MKIVLAFAIALFATLAPAQQVSQGPVHTNAVDVVVALLLGGAVTTGAALTGNLPTLCSKLKGTYAPTGVDRCPDGQWRNLVSGGK